MANTKILMNTSGKLYTYSGKLMLNVPYVYGDDCTNVTMEHTPKYLNVTIDGTDYDVTNVSWDDGFGYSTEFEGTFNGEYLLTQDSSAPCKFVLDSISGKQIKMVPSSGSTYQFDLTKIEVIQVEDGWFGGGAGDKWIELKIYYTQKIGSNPATNHIGTTGIEVSNYINAAISVTGKHQPSIISKIFDPESGIWLEGTTGFDASVINQEWTIEIQPQWTEPS
jgi:hypothetical protein